MKTSIVVAATLVVTGAVAIATRPPTPAAPDRVVAADASVAGTTSVAPAYLPAGATLRDEIRGVPGFPNYTKNQYQLAGAENADTVPPEGVTQENARRVHPAVLLSVSFTPDVHTVPPEVTTTNDFYVSTPVTLAPGVVGVLTSPRRPYGTHRVDWVDLAGYHVVMCDRLTHVEGEAGLEAAEVLRVARSLYA